MRLSWLDFFRGAAAIAVVGYHFRDYLGIGWMDWGYIAVQVFFVLSGLILGLRYTRAITEGMSFGTFAKARLLRLYPMIFISGVFILGLNAAGAPTNTNVPGDVASPLDTFLVTSLSWSSNHGAGWPSNSPIWSLWAELACNVVWFFALRAGNRWVKIIGALAMLASLGVAYHFKYIGLGSNSGWSSRAVSLAAAVAWFTVGYWLAIDKKRPVAPIVVLLALLLATVVLYEYAATTRWIVSLAIVVVCTLLINSLYQLPPPSAMVNRLAKWLGALSYPLYLIHAPAGRLLIRAEGLAMHWLAFLTAVGGAAIMATLLNEYCVAKLHKTRSNSKAGPVKVIG